MKLGFMGEFRHSLDSKNRLIIPSRFRELLGEQFVVTRGLDRCLYICPMDEWFRLQESFPSTAIATSDYRKFSRLLNAGAVSGEFDTQGRVTIPANLLEYAGITRDLVVIGVGTRAEVWSVEAWDNYRDDAEGSFNDVVEKILDRPRGAGYQAPSDQVPGSPVSATKTATEGEGVR